MAAVFLVLLLSQGDPYLEPPERLTGDARRPYLWAPLAVTLSSEKGFRGDVVVRSSFGFSFSRSVELVAGERLRIVMPAIDPDEVQAGTSRVPVRSAAGHARFLVGVDERLTFKSSLPEVDGVHYRPLSKGDLEDLLSLGLMEAFDLLLLSEPEGLQLAALETTGSWRKVGTLAEAEKAVRSLEDPPARIGVVDRRLWDCTPSEEWVPEKKAFTLFFTVVYVFAGFTALVLLGRRRLRWAAAAVVAVAVLFTAVYFLFFPRGQLWMRGNTCEIVTERGKAAEWRVWFAGTGTAIETRLELPRLVKPVFPHSAGAEDPFTIRVGERGCVIEDLKLLPGRPVCFVGVGDRSPTMQGPPFSKSLYRATKREDGYTFLGDLPAGTPVPKSPPGQKIAPREADFNALGSRFVAGECIFGWLDQEEVPASDVRSEDLAGAYERPRFFLQRLP